MDKSPYLMVYMDMSISGTYTEEWNCWVMAWNYKFTKKAILFLKEQMKVDK